MSELSSGSDPGDAAEPAVVRSGIDVGETFELGR